VEKNDDALPASLLKLPLLIRMQLPYREEADFINLKSMKTGSVFLTKTMK